jgi:hypothetical protein
MRLESIKPSLAGFFGIALFFFCCLSAQLSIAASVTVTHTDPGDGSIRVTVSGSFNSCTSCDQNGENCTTNNNGTVSLYLGDGVYPIGGASGSGSASYTHIFDRGSMHGSSTFRAKASDCTGSSTAEYEIVLDNTPTVSVTGPSGTLSEPFDITGTAAFKPTLDATKGTIYLFINGSPYVAASKSCTTEICSFSYQESAGKLYDMNHGGPYTVKLKATGSGASATNEGAFSVNKTPTIRITGPIDTVTSPFDITGTAEFKPTLNDTKGTIILYINGSPYSAAAKSCTTETCNFSYKEIIGNLYTLGQGGPYAVKMKATGGGTSVTTENVFYVDEIRPADWTRGCELIVPVP